MAKVNFGDIEKYEDSAYVEKFKKKSAAQKELTKKDKYKKKKKNKYNEDAK